MSRTGEAQRPSNAVRWALGVGAAVMVAIGLVLLFLLTLTTNNRVLYERNYAWLFGINVVVAVLLVAVLAWVALRLIMRLRRGRFGSRLLVKLAAIFALVGSAQFLLSPLTALLVLRGHTRTLNTVSWIEFAVFVAASLVLVPHFYLMGMGFARLLASLVNSMVLSFSARKYCHISLNKLLLSIMRPLIGAVLMYFLVTHVLNMSPNDGMQCFVGIMAGALFYCAWSIGSWVIFKKPEGLESTVWDALDGRWLRSRKN